MKQVLTKRSLGIMLFSIGFLLPISSFAWQPVIQDQRAKALQQIRLQQADNDLAEALEKDAYRGAQLKMLESQQNAEAIRAKNAELEKQAQEIKEPKAEKSPKE